MAIIHIDAWMRQYGDLSRELVPIMTNGQLDAFAGELDKCIKEGKEFEEELDNEDYNCKFLREAKEAMESMEEEE